MAVSSDGHGALMDHVYRHQRYFYDLTRKYYLFGRDRLIRELALGPGERLIEVGCGTGRNLIAIGRRYPDAHLFGIDASHAMLETARNAIARAGLAERIRVAHGYAEALSPALLAESLPFDRAVFSYSLSMIPDWNGALRAASACLASDGRMHIVDFADFAALGHLPAAVLRSWLRQFHVEPRAELLHSLEIAVPAPEGCQSLWISWGRYAFLWSGRGRSFLTAL